MFLILKTTYGSHGSQVALSCFSLVLKVLKSSSNSSKGLQIPPKVLRSLGTIKGTYMSNLSFSLRRGDINQLWQARKFNALIEVHVYMGETIRHKRRIKNVNEINIKDS